MKTKSFRKYLEKRLDKDEIAEIEEQAFKEFKYYFARKLRDPEYAIAYLNEALADEDKRVFLVALKNVIEAYQVNKKFS